MLEDYDIEQSAAYHIVHIIQLQSAVKLINYNMYSILGIYELKRSFYTII
jgi:hypothetical protein